MTVFAIPATTATTATCCVCHENWADLMVPLAQRGGELGGICHHCLGGESAAVKFGEVNWGAAAAHTNLARQAMRLNFMAALECETHPAIIAEMANTDAGVKGDRQMPWVFDGTGFTSPTFPNLRGIQRKVKTVLKNVPGGRLTIWTMAKPMTRAMAGRVNALGVLKGIEGIEVSVIPDGRIRVTADFTTYDEAQRVWVFAEGLADLITSNEGRITREQVARLCEGGYGVHANYRFVRKGRNCEPVSYSL